MTLEHVYCTSQGKICLQAFLPGVWWFLQSSDSESWVKGTGFESRDCPVAGDQGKRPGL